VLYCKSDGFSGKVKTILTGHVLSPRSLLATRNERTVRRGHQTLVPSLHHKRVNNQLKFGRSVPAVARFSGRPGAGRGAAPSLHSHQYRLPRTVSLSFWPRDFRLDSRLILGLAWILALIVVQLNRWALRILAVRFGRWGEPVAIVGYGPQGKSVVDFFLQNSRFGIRPAIIVDGFGSPDPTPSSLPRVHITHDGKCSGGEGLAGIQTAVLLTSEIPVPIQEALLDRQRFGFKRLILVSNLEWVGSMGVTPYDLEGLLGLEVRQNLLDPWQQFTKRLMDLGMVLLGGLLISPWLTFIALLVILSTPGGAFYGHTRLGKNGNKMKVWKFRTMVKSADQILDRYLERYPEARLEWEASQKLKDDPRITKIGSVLRKLSLDELPQLWNVFKGEMSMVGPRPIVQDEVRHYHEGYKLYKQVRPGITGLWQVSGRNDTSYNSRVRMDEYYVRNWSIWLDIYIILKTVWVVLRRDGAY
jgi:Undecaprenyl-phosphate galactose phosphotransferase WbaP